MEIGGTDDSFAVFDGKVAKPLDSSPGWRYTAPDGLRPHNVPAVDEFKKADAENDKVQANLATNARSDHFVAGFGNNGGEEFLSFMNISEAMVLKGGKDWEDWDAKMVKGLEKAQDSQGSWAGQHCITGKTFCTAGALLVLMADRTQFCPEVIKGAREKRENNEKKPAPAPTQEK